MISPRHKKNDMKVETVFLCSGGTHRIVKSVLAGKVSVPDNFDYM